MWMRRRPAASAVATLAALTGTLFLASWLSARPRMSIAPAPSPAGPAASVKGAARPATAIVFTSRTEPTHLDPRSPEAEPYREPVAVPWAAREGRLRLLDPSGSLYELTWGRTLPDGSTLVDVMSPSVSLDGTRVLFAGRRSAQDRWRIYEVGVDGAGLRQVTGLAGDPGCVAVPPLRSQADGSRIPDEERRRVDYDDVDPADLGPNGLAFASSRLPDLGRDHSRRATQVWTWAPDAKAPEAVTANRNNDRWPVLIGGEQILFSLWSRNREAVAADLSGVRPVSDGGAFATRPADHWMAAIVMTNAAQFGYAIKAVEPVWRPRPLFNGRIAYMTSTAPGAPTRLAQADWGYIRSAPSSLEGETELPYEGGAERYFGPDRDAEGRELVCACPSPMPGGAVLFAAAPAGRPVAFGIYEVADDWASPGAPPAPRLLFDDPAFVDAEPVAVYARHFVPEPRRILPPPADGYPAPGPLTLADGTRYDGPKGYLENIAMSAAIRNPIPWHDRSSGPVDPRANPLVSPPPNIASVAVYAAGRDRFDDPVRPRVPGTWERRMVIPLVGKDDFSAWVPSDPLKPTVLVGLDEAGKVARWIGAPGPNRPSRTYHAYAGDHYSGVRDGGYHYCNGCHTGHTYQVIDAKERLDGPR